MDTHVTDRARTQEMNTPMARTPLVAALALALALPWWSAHAAPADATAATHMAEAARKAADAIGGPRDALGRRAWYVQYDAGKDARVDTALRAAGGEVQHRFKRVALMNVLLPDTALAGFAADADLRDIAPVPRREPLAQVVPWNIDALQARDLWDANRDGVVDPGAPSGDGMTVCVIDTGLYADHDDFDGIALSGDSQVPGQPWFSDGVGHGTHVAGTINARNNGIGVVGALPGDAALHAVKVFDNDGHWSSGSDLAAAAELCVDAGASVINMSLGGPFSAAERSVFDALYAEGVLLVAAAGNSNGGAHVQPSYPANYPSVISVAAVDRALQAASFTQHPPSALDPAHPPSDGTWDAAELSAGGVDVMSTLAGPPGGSVPEYRVEAGTFRFEAQHINESGHGIAEATLVDGGHCIEGEGRADWNGAIVLCERGESSFAQKIDTVAREGGLAAVVFNNEAAHINPDCAGECGSDIPGLFLTQTDGLVLRDEAVGSAATAVADAGACEECNGAYGLNSGTSMATPGVAGGLALLWQACGGPDAVSARDLRILARDSARDLEGVHPQTGIAYGPGPDRVTGWGAMQLADAVALGGERFGATCAIGLAVTPRERAICTRAHAAVDYQIDLTARFDAGATLDALDTPPGASVTFTPGALAPGETTARARLGDLDTVAAGRHIFTLQATDAADPTRKASSTAVLQVSHLLPNVSSLLLPLDGATAVDATATLEWSAAPGAVDYLVEVDDDADFGSPLLSVVTQDTRLAPGAALPSLASLHWRVTSRNPCGDETSPPAQFTTGPAPGECPLGTTPRMLFEDDIEIDRPGWEHGGTRDSWLRYTTQAHSGRYAWWSRDLRVVSDQQLMSPTIALPATELPLTLSFWDRQWIESDPAGGCYDGAMLDISTDAGATWSPVPGSALLTVPYDGPIADGEGNPAAGNDAWCGDARDWTRSLVDLGAYAGRSVRLRFRLATDQSTGREPNGWHLDDLVVQACEAPSARIFGDGFETP